jgi:RNA-directed DNA polymerase
MVILSDSKPYLHTILSDMREYFHDKLKLEIKGNYQVFPVKERGIDYVGYVFRHTHILLRKSIKQNFARMLVKNRNLQSIASYNGWLLHCDSKNLRKKLLHEKF